MIVIRREIHPKGTSMKRAVATVSIHEKEH